MKDYALCSQEELEKKQRMLDCRKDNLMRMSRFDTNCSQEKLDVLYMELDITESKMAILAKKWDRYGTPDTASIVSTATRLAGCGGISL